MSPPKMDWLPKPLKSVAEMLIAIVVLVAVAVGAWIALESFISTTARAQAHDEVSEIKSAVKEIRQDSRFTRCALVAHARGRPEEIIACDDQADAPAPRK